MPKVRIKQGATTYTPARQPARVQWETRPIPHRRGDGRPKFSNLRTATLTFRGPHMSREEYNEWAAHADGEYRTVYAVFDGDESGEETELEEAIITIPSGIGYERTITEGLTVQVEVYR